MTNQQILYTNFSVEGRISQSSWGLRKTLIFVFSVLFLYYSADFVAKASTFDCGVKITISVTQGNPDIVSGKVTGVDPSQVWVVVFVQTSRWYIQPFEDSRAYIPVKPDGSYQTWIRPWQQISAFVIRKDYNVFSYNPYAPLPLRVGCKDVIAVDAYPKLQFSNYEWAIKAGDYLGPGPNYFSANTDNVWVDPQGRLHLKITHRDKWYSTEVYLMRPLGYGRYTFYVASPVDVLDKNVVDGLFLYQDLNHELDVEFSRWGVDNGPNAQFVVQPYYKPAHREQFYIQSSLELSTHIIDWKPGSVLFQSACGHDPYPPPERIIHQWTYTGEDVPTEDDEELVHLNLWLLNGHPPFDGKEAEMIIEAFEWLLEKPPEPPEKDGEFPTNFFQNHAPCNNNYELVVREGDHLQHYWFGYGSNWQWNKGAQFGANVTCDPVMFQNHTPGNNNYELVVCEGDHLQHYWFDYGGNWQWDKGAQFGANVTCDPVMFQNHTPGNNNYELVVCEGDHLQHYWFWFGGNWQWNKAAQFGSNVISNSNPAMFQNRAPGTNNYELVMREGDHLQHYWFDYGGNWQWNKGAQFGANVTCDPAMFQNRAPNANNYELVVCEGDHLQHYWFWFGGNWQWNKAAQFGSNVISNSNPAMFQNRAPGTNNYELVVREGDHLQHYWFWFGGNWQWNKGAQFGANVTCNPAMFQNRAPDANNYELVVCEGDHLQHYWFWFGGNWQWNKAAQFGQM